MSELHRFAQPPAAVPVKDHVPNELAQRENEQDQQVTDVQLEFKQKGPGSTDRDSATQTATNGDIDRSADEDGDAKEDDGQVVPGVVLGNMTTRSIVCWLHLGALSCRLMRLLFQI